MRKTAGIFLAAVAIAAAISVLYFEEAKSPGSPSPGGEIGIYSPPSGGLISSPVRISGATESNWYFEAVFPVKILDGDGSVLGAGQARAQSDWTAAGMVPFSALIPFSEPKYATGTILFAKDNPSGLPQYAGEFRLPIRFK